MRLEFKDVNADKLIAVFQPIGGIKTADAVTVHMDSDIVSVSVIDQAKVSMIKTVWMTDTQLPGERDVVIDYRHVMQVLNLFKHQDVDVTISDGGIRIKGDHGWRKIPVLDPDLKTELRFPEFDLPTQVITTTTDLKESFQYLNDITDHMTFRVQNGNVTIDSNNDVIGGEFTLPQTATGDDVARACYPWDYITGIVKCLIDGDLIIKLATDYPMVMITTHDDIQTTVMVAPRIEEE